MYINEKSKGSSLTWKDKTTMEKKLKFGLIWTMKNNYNSTIIQIIYKVVFPSEAFIIFLSMI